MRPTKPQHTQPPTHRVPRSPQLQAFPKSPLPDSNRRPLPYHQRAPCCRLLPAVPKALRAGRFSGRVRGRSYLASRSSASSLLPWWWLVRRPWRQCRTAVVEYRADCVTTRASRTPTRLHARTIDRCNREWWLGSIAPTAQHACLRLVPLPVHREAGCAPAPWMRRGSPARAAGRACSGW